MLASAEIHSDDWANDYGAYLSARVAWIAGDALFGPRVMRFKGGRRDRLVQWLRPTATRRWHRNLELASQITAVDRSYLRALARSANEDVVVLCLLAAADDSDELSLEAAARRFAANGVRLQVPVAIRDSVLQGLEALREASMLLRNGLGAPNFTDAVDRAGGALLRIAYLADRAAVGRELPEAVLPPPRPPRPRPDFLIAVYHDNDPYWRGKPEATGLVVMPRAEAYRLGRFRRALSSSTTWHELVRKIRDWETREHVMRELEGEIPEPEIWIDRQDVGDDFLPDPKRLMLEWLPESVKQLGRVVDAEWLHIPEDSLDELVVALATEGYAAAVDRRHVVLDACGYTRP